jgi:heme/copper-type cytochrome/quinol oxidase subunit 2
MPSHSAKLPIILLAQEGGRESPTSVEHAWALFGTTALLLILFVVVVAVVAAGRIRRQRREQQRRSDEPPSPDAWEEAGRRAKG